MAARWWHGQSAERYWLEATDREDIGADLRAPLADASGRDNWRYTLFREADIGDVVFHYDSGSANAIVGWSRVAGKAEPQSIVWAARGSYARERGDTPVERSGYRIPLSGYTRLPRPITLAALGRAKAELIDLVRSEQVAGHKPLYFPFELSSRRDLRPLQGYAFKLPASFIGLFPELAEVTAGVVAGEEPSSPGRNPTWVRDELILALDLYMTNPVSPPGKSSKAVIELSQVLNRLDVQLGRDPAATYRNPAGVYMKMMNFRRFDPAVVASGKVGLQRGGKDEEAVWREFADDRERLARVAAILRATIALPAADQPPPFDDDETAEAEEGRILTRLHRTRERSRKLVDDRKRKALDATGALKCEACEFDFSQTYGARGQGFIEVHHTRPLHTLDPGTKTRLEDLALLCANCHRMVHATRSWLSMDELRRLIGANTQTLTIQAASHHKKP